MHRLRGAWTGRHIIVLLALALLVTVLAGNVAGNLQRRGLSLTFEFLARPASFDVPFQLIEFSSRDSYAKAAFVALLNTMLVACLAILLATAVGFLFGTFLLSPNPLLKAAAFGLVELIKNTPQVLQILFWYVLILTSLPGARESFVPLPNVYLNVRGLFLPSLQVRTAGGGEWLGTVTIALLLVCLSAYLLARLSPHGQRLRNAGRVLGGAAVLGVVLWVLSGAALVVTSAPELKGFNFQGGVKVLPELVALWIGLAVYAASFIADLVRGAVLAVPKGQQEAADSLGLEHWQTLWLVRIPQALQIIVPPLVSQYLNIIKSSTLGIAIAYPEIMTVVGGTTLNQTGHAIECMLLIMLVFVLLNLAVSFVMNRYNRRIATRGTV